LQEGEPLENAYAALKGWSNKRTLLQKLSGTPAILKPGEKRRGKEALARRRDRKKVRKEQNEALPGPFPSNGPASYKKLAVADL
jgi:small subunit ribosomal protein S21